MVQYACLHYVLVYTLRPSSVIDIRSLRGSHCDTDHCLVIETIGERSLKKGIKQNLVADWYKLNNLLEHELEYQIDISDRLSVLESLEISSVHAT